MDINVDDKIVCISENKFLTKIYELSDIYGFIEVKFRTNIPKSEIREIKLQKLFK